MAAKEIEKALEILQENFGNQPYPAWMLEVQELLILALVKLETHETESALRARILELENGNAYLHEVSERAESEANLQIAELRAVNSEQAGKIVALQTHREEHLRTIADLMGEKAELVEALILMKNVGAFNTETWKVVYGLIEKHTAK